MKSDQLEEELRKGMEKDLRLQRHERQGTGSNNQYELEIAQLKERCEELEDNLKMVHDENDASASRYRKEIRKSGAFVDCQDGQHGHEIGTKHFVKINASSNRFSEV